MSPPASRRAESAARPDSLRGEIAAVAAGLVADAGLDYASAKRKAARQVLGDATVPRGAIPDNAAIDDALREHLTLFDDGHAARVQRMRSAALQLMRTLQAFNPHLTGAVWKGIVAEHAPIHLQLFCDSPKDVEIFLLNRGLDFAVGEVADFRSGDGGRADVEALSLAWQGEPVVLSLYETDALRGALRGAPPERGGPAAVERLLAAT